MKKRKTPLQQLLPLLTRHERDYVLESLIHLKTDVAEEMSLALVCYIRYGITRPFASPFLRAIFDFLTAIIDERKKYTDHSTLITNS